METTYDRIMDAWEEAGYPRTQVSITRHLGISQPAAAKWKKGGAISSKVLLTIATKTGVSPGWLLTGKGQKRIIIPDRDQAEWMRLYDELSPEDRQKAVEILRLLSREK